MQKIMLSGKIHFARLTACELDYEGSLEIDPELLAEAVREKPAARSGTEAETPELFVENGLWGYRTPEQVVVPPLYDCGFDFTEGLAAVQLGGTWHYIDTAGRTRLSCPGCAAVKPFRGGKAQVVRNGERQEIAHPLKTPRYQ